MTVPLQVQDTVRVFPGKRRCQRRIRADEIVSRSAVDEVFGAFKDQVLPFGAAAATRYPMIVIRRDRAGRPINGFNAQIASICHAHDAALAARHLKDFQDTGIALLDPWQAA